MRASDGCGRRVVGGLDGQVLNGDEALAMRIDGELQALQRERAKKELSSIAAERHSRDAATISERDPRVTDVHLDRLIVCQSKRDSVDWLYTQLLKQIAGKS